MKSKIFTLALIILSAMPACRKRGDLSGHSSLNGISYIYTISGSAVKADIDQANRVKFYIDVNGQREPVLSLDDTYRDGSVKGVKVGDNNWRIEWLGVTIGEKRGEITEICGPKFGYAEICDATFIQRSPTNKNSKNFMILRLLDQGVQKMPLNAHQGGQSEGLNLTNKSSNDAFIDIANYATNEINQYGTGTCLYNSTTGIVEWYRNRASGKIERLSAPYVLANLFEDVFTGEVGAINATKNMKKVAPDTVLPTQETYNQFNAFQPVYDYARSRSKQITPEETVATPQIRGTKLFMLSQPALGDFGAQGASQEQMNSIRDWLFSKKTPVHFFHYYYNSGIWHAVMALGWDEQRQLIKIKDSLSQSGRNGQWRSLASYQAMVYGAMGTEAADTSTISTDASSWPSTSGSKPTNPELQQNNSATNGDSTTPTSSTSTKPQANNGLLSELNWLAVIQGSTMYIYVSRDVSDVSIRGYGNQWLPLPDRYDAQPGIPTIRGIYINRTSWNSQSTVDVRVIYKGQDVAAQVPIQFR